MDGDDSAAREVRERRALRGGEGRAERKKGLSAIRRMRFEAFRADLSAQIIHLRPSSEEGRAIERIHRSIEKLGGEPRGKHHEIYLSDFRRTNPERLRTVIRQPFAERS